MAKTVSVTLDDDQEIQTIILKQIKPLASELAVSSPTEVRGGTSTATATATYSNGQTDVTADVNIDL